MTAVKSGWYPDPDKPELLRYWDGEQWTDRTMLPKGLVAPSQSDSRARPALLWAALGAVVAGAACVLALFFLFKYITSPDPSCTGECVNEGVATLFVVMAPMSLVVGTGFGGWLGFAIAYFCRPSDPETAVHLNNRTERLLFLWIPACSFSVVALILAMFFLPLALLLVVAFLPLIITGLQRARGRRP